MMLLKQLALAATAAAMLVLPDTTDIKEEDGAFRIMPVEADIDAIPATATKQNFLVPCARCPGRAAQLELDFSVDKQERLLVNGFEIYPGPDVWSSKLSASIVSDGQQSDSQQLGYSLSIVPEDFDEVQKMELIRVELRVIEVGDRFIDGIPVVRVRLIRSPDQGLLIGSIDTNASDKPESGHSCDSMWCRVSEMIDKAYKDVTSGFKGCGGMKGKGHHKGHKGHKGHHGHHGGKMGHHKEHAEDDGSERGHRHHRPHHGFHGHRHSFGRILRHIGAFIVLPVFLGISAGFGVGILSLLIFSAIRRVVNMVRGKRLPDHEAIATRCNATADKMFAEDDEKSGLMTHQEAPPQYEDHSRD